MPGRKLGPWSEFPFLYRFTVLSNSGGSNSPWSEFWSEFPRFFMGMGVVPAPSDGVVRVLVLWKREAATGPESRNHLSDSKETKKRLFDPGLKKSLYGHL